jgi:hypothetical protein
LVFWQRCRLVKLCKLLVAMVEAATRRGAAGAPCSEKIEAVEVHDLGRHEGPRTPLLRVVAGVVRRQFGAHAVAASWETDSPEARIVLFRTAMPSPSTSGSSTARTGSGQLNGSEGIPVQR